MSAPKIIPLPSNESAMERQLKRIIFDVEEPLRNAIDCARVLALALHSATEQDHDSLQYVAYQVLDNAAAAQALIYPNGGLPWGPRNEKCNQGN